MKTDRDEWIGQEVLVPLCKFHQIFRAGTGSTGTVLPYQLPDFFFFPSISLPIIPITREDEEVYRGERKSGSSFSGEEEEDSRSAEEVA